MRLIALIAAAGIAAAATPAFADDWDFVLTNDTGKQVKQVEISPAGANVWVANRVEEGVAVRPLTAGGRTTIHFDKPASQCRFDLRATFADDTSAVWSNVNLCDNSYVAIRYKNGTPAFTAN